MHVIRNVVKTVKLVVFGGIALVIAIFVGLGVARKYADAPPSASKAPFEVLTSSRIYLGKELSTISGFPELTDYWYLQGGKYHYVKGSIGFPTDQYGQVEVVSRFNSGS